MRQTTRRRLLTLTGATAIGGIGYLTIGSDNVQAQLTVNSLSIPDKTKSVTGSINDIILKTTFNYSFTSNVPLDECIFRLRVGTTTNDLQTLIGDRKTGLTTSESGSSSLQASIFKHPNLDSSMFDPPTQESVSQSIVVQVKMVLSKSGETVETRTVQANPMITIQDETVTVDSSLSGGGGLTVDGA